eukprot:Sdes_comp22276_c0_seq1m20768
MSRKKKPKTQKLCIQSNMKHKEKSPLVPKKTNKIEFINPQKSSALPPRNIPSAAKVEVPPLKKSSFLDKMKRTLDGSRFRWLNERLYTMQSADAFKMMSQDPSLFDIYHSGYRQQVEKWPKIPVDVMIDYILENCKPNQKTASDVADFGCGDGKIAKSVPNRVFSIDLVKCPFTSPSETTSSSKNPSESFVNPQNKSLAIACNMSKTPLKKNSISLAVFCLSLMGTDFLNFLKEAHRILIDDVGLLKIAEVSSRIVSLDSLVSVIEKIGFFLIHKDLSSDFFVDLTFRKKSNSSPSSFSPPVTTHNLLKPCLYKKR